MEGKPISTTINAKELRGSLPKLVERVRKGARFVVIYRSRPSLVVMQELKVRQALTTDEHFRQMGFQMLPSPAIR